MKRFLTEDEVWPTGWTKWHVYYTPVPAEIAALHAAYQPVLHRFTEYLAPVRPDWLHVTLGAVQDRPTNELTPQQCTSLSRRVRALLARTEPITLTAGPAVTTSVGVVLDLVPDAAMQALQQSIREVITEVVGTGAAYAGGGRPHLALAYCTRDVDSGAVQPLLRKATDQRATLTVAEVAITDVTQDSTRSEFRWKTWERVPCAR